MARTAAELPGGARLTDFVSLGVLTARAAELISERLAAASRARERYVHGEDVEKRANARALAGGRGRNVLCEALVPRALLFEHLRVTPEALAAIQASYRIGFARLGTHNWLVQAANGLAAVFLACGQDVAYVGESAPLASQPTTAPVPPLAFASHDSR